MLAKAKELLLDELKSMCDQVNEYDDLPTCSPIISEFIEKVISYKIFKPFLDELKQEEFKDCADRDALLKRVSQQLWPICEDCSTYAKKNGMMDTPILIEIMWMDNREFTANGICEQYDAFRRFLRALFEDTSVTHSDFIKKYAIINEDDKAQPIKPFFTLDELKKELHSLDRIRKTKAWFSVLHLFNFYVIYNPKIYEAQRNLFGNDFFSSQTILAAQYNALEYAMNPATATPFYAEALKVNDYKDHMRRLFHFLSRKMFLADITPTKKRSRQKKYTLNWDSINLCAIVNGIALSPLMRGKGPAQLLELISQSKIILTSGISFKSAFNKIVGSPDGNLDASQAKAVHDVCSGINKYFKLAGYPKPIKVSRKKIFLTPNFDLPS